MVAAALAFVSAATRAASELPNLSSVQEASAAGNTAGVVEELSVKNQARPESNAAPSTDETLVCGAAVLDEVVELLLPQPTSAVTATTVQRTPTNDLPIRFPSASPLTIGKNVYYGSQADPGHVENGSGKEDRWCLHSLAGTDHHDHVTRRAMRSRIVGALAAVLVLSTAAGCGSSDRRNDAAVGAPTDETVLAFTPSTSPATDTQPILELIDACYGACGAVAPGSLPSVAVYPDGTIVRSGYATAGGDAQRTLASYDGRLDEATLATLVDEARAADLTLGGVGVNGTTQGTADGGGVRFVTRLDGTEGAFEVPFLTSSGASAGDDPAGGDPEQRAALAAIGDHLRALGTDVAVNPRRGTRWVVLAAPSVGASPNASWSAPDPASLETSSGLISEFPALGVEANAPLRCGLLTPGDDRAKVLAAAADGYVVARVGGAVWALGGRPLLPHEHSCADVAATVAAQHLVELADLRGG